VQFAQEVVKLRRRLRRSDGEPLHDLWIPRGNDWLDAPT
jgi:hypothetical protein